MNELINRRDKMEDRINELFNLLQKEADLPPELHHFVEALENVNLGVLVKSEMGRVSISGQKMVAVNDTSVVEFIADEHCIEFSDSWINWRFKGSNKRTMFTLSIRRSKGYKISVRGLLFYYMNLQENYYGECKDSYSAT